MDFSNISSRITIDNTIFTFGTYECDGENCFGYKVYCAGESSHHVESIMPLKGEKLRTFIDSFKSLKDSNFKKKIKMKLGWSCINFHFGGKKDGKGVKLRTYITGWLFFSSATFGSFVKESEIDNLIEKLDQCNEQ